MVKTLNKLIFTELRGRTVSVLASGNRVLQIGTAPEREDCALGTICVGRVRNIVKNINAAFGEGGRPGINGYYSLAENRFHLFADGRDGSSPLKNGDEILVQISREDSVRPRRGAHLEAFSHRAVWSAHPGRQRAGDLL